MPSAIEAHIQILEKLCRVCGTTIPRHGKTFQVKNYTENLNAAFWIGVENDLKEIHQTKFCSACYFAINNMLKKGRTHSQNVFQWQMHSNNCQVCMQTIVKSKGGRKPTCHWPQTFHHTKCLDKNGL